MICNSVDPARSVLHAAIAADATGCPNGEPEASGTQTLVDPAASRSALSAGLTRCLETGGARETGDGDHPGSGLTCCRR